MTQEGSTKPPARRGTKKVVIVMHENDVPDFPYLIGPVASFWEKAGIEVETVFGIGREVVADLAVNHVNLTVVPDDYLAYLGRFSRTMNIALRDISKRAWSRNVVTPADGWDGPVIVKSDLNSGGMPETRLGGPDILGRAVGFVSRRLGFRSGLAHARKLKARDYAVFDSVAEVPAGVFANPALVVERFLPERRGELYGVRHLFCLGEHYVNVEAWSPSPIVKGVSVVESRETPAGTRIIEERRRLGLDYGKIDYVERDGDVVVFDVNRTPGDLHPFEYVTAEQLAGGIERYLRD